MKVARNRLATVLFVVVGWASALAAVAPAYGQDAPKVTREEWRFLLDHVRFFEDEPIEKIRKLRGDVAERVAPALAIMEDAGGDRAGRLKAHRKAIEEVYPNFDKALGILDRLTPETPKLRSLRDAFFDTLMEFKLAVGDLLTCIRTDNDFVCKAFVDRYKPALEDWDRLEIRVEELETEGLEVANRLEQQFGTFGAAMAHFEPTARDTETGSFLARLDEATGGAPGAPGPATTGAAQEIGAYVRFDNGTAVDTRTGLMWMSRDYRNLMGRAPGAGLETPREHKQAILDWVRLINERRYGGYSDWRLPTVEELAGICDLRSRVPAFDHDEATRSAVRNILHVPAAFEPGGGYYVYAAEGIDRLDEPDTQVFSFADCTAKTWDRYGHETATIRLVRYHGDVELQVAEESPGPAGKEADPVAECDRLAAHPNDPKKVGEGVPFGKIEPAAVEVCAAAREQAPDSLRIQYQYARALQRSGRIDEAVELYRDAAVRGYAAAQHNLAVLYRRGRGVPQDLE